jgi:tetratricopeptide (TPR) repeat protein
MNKLATAALVAIATSSLWAIQGTISTETDRKSGDLKWQSRQKSYLLTYKKGNTNLQMEFPLDSVTSLDIAKPAGFDKAVEMVQKGQGSAAIPVLEKVVKEYKMLQWDKPAGRYLVEAYIAANRVEDAYKAAQNVIADDKEAAYKGELAPAYWQVLLKLGKNQQLESCLKKAASSGDRASSAEALIVRGDVILNQEGETPDALKRALTDAYLRVALMYPDEPCRQARANAMMRCATCFDKLGMAARAEGMRTQAKAL